MGFLPPLRSLLGGEAACPECGSAREKTVRRHPVQKLRYEMWVCDDCDMAWLADDEPVEEYATEGRPEWRRLR